jgi:hypothetical protein
LNRIRMAVVFGCALFWVSSANADCTSESQCDDVGNCAQVETCDDVLDIVQASPNASTPIAAESDPLASAPVAAAVAATGTNCREVDICGTAQQVCD